MRMGVSIAEQGGKIKPRSTRSKIAGAARRPIAYMRKFTVELGRRFNIKKINSIGYGHKIIGLALLFLAVIPVCCLVFSLIFQAAIFFTLRNISLGIGFLITLFFIGLLFIELYQDKKIERQYPHVMKNKLKLDNGQFECQSCGNRQLTVMDENCVICGMKFNNN